MNINSIVKSNLCTGCGVCISEDDTKKSRMVWNNEGFLVPELGIHSSQEKMVKVCPFYNNQKSEDDLGREFIENNLSKYDEKLGFYINSYAGYANDFRNTSSSGGLATYIFQSLLKKKIVDHLFVVTEEYGQYSYQIFSNIDDILKTSKTRYTPVTLEKLFTLIESIEGKVALSGVACFVKALRLKQHYYPELKEKIPFVVGIICGGLKSKYYTDFLAQSAGCKSSYESVEYRVKNENSNAMDYKFKCIAKNEKRIHMVEMKTLGDMWGTGLFKSNACDFCDDVVTELADISLGDAWIKPYDKDGKGNNVVITRSITANQIIQEGIILNELMLDDLSLERLIQSQSGSFNHRHRGLLFRLKKFDKKFNIKINKRMKFLKKQNFIFNLIQSQRMLVRERSLVLWCQEKNIIGFNYLMSPIILKLRLYAKIYRIYLKYKYSFNKLRGFK